MEIDPLLLVGIGLIGVAILFGTSRSGVRNRVTGISTPSISLPDYRPGETMTMILVGSFIGGGLAAIGFEPQTFIVESLSGVIRW